MLCVLLAYIFLIGPEAFHRLAQADTQYSQLSTLDWGKGNRIIEYDYDDNGSLTSKITTEGQTTVEQVVYDYNLQNRLSRVGTYDDTQTLISSVEYRYNPQGIRVAKVEHIGGTTIQTDYLIDSYNHTGYAQVLEETTDDGTTLTGIQYTLGDDVLSQTKSTWTGSAWTANPTQYLLYDGHGSTRQLVSQNQTLQQSYNYDAYGTLLQGASAESNPGITPQQETSLLYAGEQFDTNSQMYNLRARYYNPGNGRFNRVDPYSGNLHDPQSLHKYLYCHNNPINNIDPTGESIAAIQTLSVTAIMSRMLVAAFPYVMAGLLALTTAATLAIIYEMTHEFIVAGLASVAAVIMSNTKTVSKAIDDVAKALGKTVRQLRKYKFFPVIKSLTPDIFAFNVKALATHPWWFILNYVGVGPAGDKIAKLNRNIVEARWGFLRITKPGFELDEFPYARTVQGGLGAVAQMVDPIQHRVQGGLFGVFCRWTMRGAPGQFIVVPIPL